MTSKNCNIFTRKKKRPLVSYYPTRLNQQSFSARALLYSHKIIIVTFHLMINVLLFSSLTAKHGCATATVYSMCMYIYSIHRTLYLHVYFEPVIFICINIIIMHCRYEIQYIIAYRVFTNLLDKKSCRSTHNV